MNVPVFLGGWVFKITLWVLACWARRLIRMFLWCLPRPRKWTNVPWKETMLKGHVIFQASVFRVITCGEKLASRNCNFPATFVQLSRWVKNSRFGMLISFQKQHWFGVMFFSICFLAPKRFKDSNKDIGRRCGQTRWNWNEMICKDYHIEKTQLYTPKELWCYIFFCLTWLTPLHHNKSTPKTSGWKKVSLRFLQQQKVVLERQKFDLGSWRMWDFNVSW